MPVFKNIVIKKYLITDDKGALILINAKDRIEALNLLNNSMTEGNFDKVDFRMDKIDAELRDDGNLVIYKEDDKDEAGSK